MTNYRKQIQTLIGLAPLSVQNSAEFWHHTQRWVTQCLPLTTRYRGPRLPSAAIVIHKGAIII